MTVTVYRGLPYTLVSEWRPYVGGALVDLDASPTMTIRLASTGAIVVGPTTSGVVHSGTGVYAYNRTESPTAVLGMYVATWSGLYAGAPVTATDTILALERGDADNLYATLSEFKARRNIAATDRDDDLLDALTGACRSIDDVCGRRFWRDSAPTTVVISGAGRVSSSLWDGDVLAIPDIATTTGLVVEMSTLGSDVWTTIVSTRYRPEPWGTPDITSDAYCYLRGPVGCFGSALTDFRITATFGWPSVPRPIKSAALLLANRLYGRKDSPDGIRGSAEWMVRVAKTDPDVASLIGPYQRPAVA